MKTIPELKEVVVKREQKRLAMSSDIGTIRTDIKNLEQLHFRAKCFGFELDVDEPSERGGTHTGLDPLGYFVVGAASCFLTQVARVIMIRGLDIDDLEMSARAHYDMAKKREFSDIIYDIRMTGSEKNENVTEMIYEAERRCFPHRTLSRAIPLTSNVIFNGSSIISHTVGPENK